MRSFKGMLRLLWGERGIRCGEIAATGVSLVFEHRPWVAAVTLVDLA